MVCLNALQPTPLAIIRVGLAAGYGLWILYHLHSLIATPDARAIGHWQFLLLWLLEADDSIAKRGAIATVTDIRLTLQEPEYRI